MPRSDLRQSAALIRRTLTRERQMREHVFRRDPNRLAAKCAEIDAALEALGALEDALQLVREPPPPIQADLFG